MEHTFLTAEANEMIAAVQELKKAQNRVFVVISDYFGDEHPTTLKASEWIADSDAKLEPILGALMLAEMGYNNAVKTK